MSDSADSVFCQCLLSCQTVQTVSCHVRECLLSCQTVSFVTRHGIQQDTVMSPSFVALVDARYTTRHCHVTIQPIPLGVSFSKAQSSKLERFFCHISVKRDVRALSFELSNSIRKCDAKWNWLYLTYNKTLYTIFKTPLQTWNTARQYVRSLDTVDKTRLRQHT